MTIAEASAVFNMSDVFAYFLNGSSFLQASVISDMFENDAAMGLHGVPQMPLFVYKAIADEISYTNYTDALVDKYCDNGASILYERNTVGGHLAEETNGDARAFAWLQTVLSGKHQAQGCTIRNVTLNTTDSAL